MSKNAVCLIAAGLLGAVIAIAGEPSAEFTFIVSTSLLFVVIARMITSVIGWTPKQVNIERLSGPITQLTAHDAAIPVIREFGIFAGLGPGWMDMRIGDQSAEMIGSAMLRVGDTVTAAGIPGAKFEVLAVRNDTAGGAYPATKASHVFKNPAFEIVTAIVCMPFFIGFYFAYNIIRKYDRTHGQQHAVDAALEMVGSPTGKSQTPGEIWI